MMMPISASTPRIATKPSGWPVGSSAATTPISPSGATLTTRNSFWKLCSCSISTVAIRNSISGTTAAIGLSHLPLSSTLPPTATE